ncbi:uncharacterized protein VP01_2140g3 [Puccinia sorghi]|uniref:Transposase n=1 Tax=Puccinia sorghi TaxID=27349 RepID=A0A0L6VAD4_9BASI|nr:uncharacterized protein VP01_2140g3 [Puccinia sorghi]
MVYIAYAPAKKVAVVQMTLHGHTQVAICNILGYSISCQSLGRWLTFYKETCAVVFDPDDYKERGRPKLLNAEDSMFMVWSIYR